MSYEQRKRTPMTRLTVNQERGDNLLAACADRDRISIDDVVDKFGATGFPLLLLARPALIPIPGPYGMVFGTAVAILAIQMAIGRSKPWLLAVLGRRSVSTRVLTNAGNRARGWLVKIENLHSSDRFKWLARNAGRAASLVILPLAIMIGLPIPLPARSSRSFARSRRPAPRAYEGLPWLSMRAASTPRGVVAGRCRMSGMFSLEGNSGFFRRDLIGPARAHTVRPIFVRREACKFRGRPEVVQMAASSP